MCTVCVPLSVRATTHRKGRTMLFTRLATLAGVLLVIAGTGHLIYIFAYQYSDALQHAPDQLTREQNSELNRALAEDVRLAVTRVLAGIGLGALGEIGAAFRRLQSSQRTE